MSPYHQSENFILYQGDSLSLINELEDNSIDVVFADPPYFLSSGRKMDIAGRKVAFEKGLWDRMRSPQEIDEFNEKWIKAVRQKMKENVCLLIMDLKL